MINIDSLWIDYSCPSCSYQDQVQLIDIKTEKTIFCHNCKISIKLIDSNGSSHTAINDINNALNDLENLLKNF